MGNSGPNWRPGGLPDEDSGPRGLGSGPGPGPEPFPQRGDFSRNEPELTECLVGHLVKPPTRVGEILAAGRGRFTCRSAQRLVLRYRTDSLTR